MPYDIKKFVFTVSLCAIFAVNPVLATAPGKEESVGTAHDVYVESNLNKATQGIAGVGYVNRMVDAAGNAAQAAEAHAAAAGAHALSAAQSAQQAHDVLNEKLDSSGWASDMAMVTDRYGTVGTGFITPGMIASGITGAVLQVSYGSGGVTWGPITPHMLGETSGTGSPTKFLGLDGSGMLWAEASVPTHNIIPYNDYGEIAITGMLKVGGGFSTSGPSGYVYAATITEHDIGFAAVTSDKIYDGTIVAADLASSSVTTTKIAGGAVTIDKTAGVVGMIPVGAEGAKTYGSFWIE